MSLSLSRSMSMADVGVGMGVADKAHHVDLAIAYFCFPVVSTYVCVPKSCMHIFPCPQDWLRISMHDRERCQAVVHFSTQD